MNDSFIKLFRKFKDWEWYDDINVKVVFLHLLLSVNYKEKSWRGVLVKPWEVVTSHSNLALETGLTVKQIRLCLDKLKRTSEIEINSTNNFSVIKLNKWLKYNWNDIQEDTEKTIEGQSEGTQRATTKERKEYKKEKNIYNITSKNKFYEETSFEFSTAKDFLYFHLDNKTPSVVYELNTKTEFDIINEWADEVRKLLKIDKYSEEQISFIINFTKNDDFWKNQILTLKKFRKKNSDWIPYFVVMINEAKSKSSNKNKKQVIIN